MRLFHLKLFFAALLLLFIGNGVKGSALIQSTITGRVAKVNWYHGRIVRITVERLSWPNSRRFVVLESGTKVYYEGKQTVPVSPFNIMRGKMVRATGGLSVSGRIVADKIIILKTKRR